MKTFKERFDITGAVVAAVDLLKGIGKYAGLDPIEVPGATGYIDTDYEGKVAATLQALREKDLVFLHVEAPDETSHEGSLRKKIQAIEEFDKHIVGEMLAFQKRMPSLTLLVAPDHATPVSIKTHSSGPVPFVACGGTIEPGKETVYSEDAAREKPVYSGPDLFERFIRGTLQK